MHWHIFYHMGQYIIAYVQNPPFNTHVDISSGVRNLNFGMSIPTFYSMEFYKGIIGK